MSTFTASTREEKSAQHQVEPQIRAAVFDLYDLLASPSLLRPLWVVYGILIGFALCCLSGRLLASTNLFENFHRFHNYINPTTSFYPTVSQMVSLVESNSKPDQTIVIIGGNSIFYGFGQNTADLWSLALQKDLGAQYAVFNFAMPSSDPFEGAYWATEALLKKHKKVIYATVARPATTGYPEGSDVYGYAFWDAHEKHLLCHDKERDTLILARISGHNAQKRQKLEDLRMRMQLDSIFYFEDLWTAVGYSKFFTVWTDSTAADPFKARRVYSGEQYHLVPIEKRVKTEFIKALKSNYSSCFEPDSAVPTASFWSLMASHAKELTPDNFKANCLVLVATPMPRYMSLLPELDRKREQVAFECSQKAWSSAGFQSTDFAGRLSDVDYADGVHLAESGGKKVAAIVATNVRSLATKLGYAE